MLMTRQSRASASPTGPALHLSGEEMTMDNIETAIIDCGGRYEVHPSKDGTTWCVVNGETGQVRASHGSRQDAVRNATALNAQEA